MAKADVKIVSPLESLATFKMRTAAGATAILAGEPVRIAPGTSNYVTPVATAQPTAAAKMFGIAAEDSTQTATADGTVLVHRVVPGETVMKCRALDPTAIDTDSEILGLTLDVVEFDLTGGVYTINQSAGGTFGTEGLIFLDANKDTGEIEFLLTSYAYSLGAVS